MKLTRFVCLSLLLTVTLTHLKAQEMSKREMEEAAYHYFGMGDYVDAYPLFDKLAAENPKNIDYRFRLGIICLHYPMKKNRAIEIFTQLRSEVKGPEIDYYLGKSYHLNYKFDEAIPYLEKYVEEVTGTNKKDERDMMLDAKHSAEQCKHGKFLIDNRVIAEIINIGEPLNTEELEGSPIISTDESMIIFTYAGKNSMGGKLNEDLQPDKDGHYREDVMMSFKETDTTYGPPIPIESINTLGNDAAIAISPDGMTLFTFASNNDDGDIYVSHLVGFEWSKPVKLNKNINSEAWEGSCSISGDGRHLYFSSERPGGFGKKDIYVSDFENGDWGPAKNLGSKINTEYNDDAPFIHPDGITLFFSSEGHTSIGGYDIMFSVKKDNEWTEPKNMGLPLNTTEDDRYYVINSKGDKGFFSSDRAGAGGKGSLDIYMVTPGVLGDKPIIALLKGHVYGNDKPIKANIEVVKIVQQESIGPFESNEKTGKYLMALSPGYIYRIKVKAEGYESVEEDLDIENLDKYMEANKDFYLYAPGSQTNIVATETTTPTETVVSNPTVTPTETVVAVETTTTESTPTETVATVETKTTESTPTETIASTEPCSSQILPDLNSIKGKSLNDLSVYKQLLGLAGDYCADGLVFKVQIGAYRFPNNYKYNHLIQYGKPEITEYPDGITRFTQKEFKTIKEAEKHRQKAIAKGQKDAWIVAFVNGKRYTLEELIMVDFLGKSIN
ncbi:MAG: PD40 domain-containing protein [Sphingobacteriaceae bacterium]|nr:PD40 domain-containing protein [Sphingobacteriaceae bacterium]